MDVTMVSSKRCKICSDKDPGNFSICDNYFGRTLSDIIQNVAGVKLNPCNVSRILICQHCAVLLIQAEIIIGKVRGVFSKRHILNCASKSTLDMTKFKKFSDCVPSGVEPCLSENNSQTDDGLTMFRRSNECRVSYPEESLTDRAVDNSIRQRFCSDIEKSIIVNPDNHKISKTKRKYCLSPDRNQLQNESENTSNNILSESVIESQSSQEMKDFESSLRSDKKNKKLKTCTSKKAAGDVNYHRGLEAPQTTSRLECPNCGMEFKSQQKYTSHIFSQRCKNAVHPCQFPTCNKRFQHVYKMELHMKEKHQNESDFEDTLVTRTIL